MFAINSVIKIFHDPDLKELEMPKHLASIIINNLDRESFIFLAAKSQAHMLYLQKNPEYLMGPHQFFEKGTEEYEQFKQTLFFVSRYLISPGSAISTKAQNEMLIKMLASVVSKKGLIGRMKGPLGVLEDHLKGIEHFAPMKVREVRNWYWVILRITDLSNQLSQVSEPSFNKFLDDMQVEKGWVRFAYKISTMIYALFLKAKFSLKLFDYLFSQIDDMQVKIKNRCLFRPIFYKITLVILTFFSRLILGVNVYPELKCFIEDWPKTPLHLMMSRMKIGFRPSRRKLKVERYEHHVKMLRDHDIELPTSFDLTPEDKESFLREGYSVVVLTDFDGESVQVLQNAQDEVVRLWDLSVSSYFNASDGCTEKALLSSQIDVGSDNILPVFLSVPLKHLS